jgi:hypothetical protein
MREVPEYADSSLLMAGLMSPCGRAPVIVKYTGWPDPQNAGTTAWYECTHCWEPCDPLTDEVTDEEFWSGHDRRKPDRRKR